MGKCCGQAECYSPPVMDGCAGEVGDGHERLHKEMKMKHENMLIRAQLALFFKDLVRHPDRIGEDIDTYLTSVDSENLSKVQDGGISVADKNPFFEMGIAHDRLDLIFDITKGNNSLTLEAFSTFSLAVIDYMSKNVALGRVGIVTTYFSECIAPVKYILEKYTKIQYTENKKEISLKTNDTFYLKDVECNEIRTYLAKDEEAKYVNKIGFCTKVDINTRFMEEGLPIGFERKLFDAAMDINKNKYN